MQQTLKNELLTVSIDSLGAELAGVTDNRTNHQFLYQGNTDFWDRRSPVLFPLIGNVWNGVFRMDGKEWPMGQHGFARDKEFTIMEGMPDDEAWFAFESDDATLAVYPRRFRLEIGYRLHETRLTVMWRVRNLDDKEMSFHIGAHPGFYYPDFNPSDPVHGYLLFDRTSLTTQLIKEKGCIGEETMEVATDSEGMVPIKSDTFDIDTIILADSQVHRVSLLGKDRRPYLSVLFDAPVVGIWSKCHQAPYVCIEPWWGRADRIGFEGDFSEREYAETLAPGETFSASYMIIFERV